MSGIFINAEQTNNYTKAIPEKNQQFYNECACIYHWMPNMADTFFVKDGQLYDTIIDSPPSHSFPVSDSEYMSKSDLGTVIFGRDDSGKVTYYTYALTDGQKVRVPKVK
jgi:hypothetical protein